MIALVTGASKGIGAACALALSDAGHRVALVARDEDALRRVAASLPGEALVVPADLLDPAAPDAVFARVEEEWGPVELLVVNAGASMSAPLVATTDEDWQRMLDLNLTAPFRCLRRALPAMTGGGLRPGRRDRLGGRQDRQRPDRGVHREQARCPRPGPHGRRPRSPARA